MFQQSLHHDFSYILHPPLLELLHICAFFHYQKPHIQTLLLEYILIHSNHSKMKEHLMKSWFHAASHAAQRYTPTPRSPLEKHKPSPPLRFFPCPSSLLCLSSFNFRLQATASTSTSTSCPRLPGLLSPSTFSLAYKPFIICHIWYYVSKHFDNCTFIKLLLLLPFQILSLPGFDCNNLSSLIFLSLLMVSQYKSRHINENLYFMHDRNIFCFQHIFFSLLRI